MSHWVQHISGQGEKWEVEPVGPVTTAWRVKGAGPEARAFDLPKSEYRLCEPPAPVETWTDVTASCELVAGQWEAQGKTFLADTRVGVRVAVLSEHQASAQPYRLRKVQTKIMGAGDSAYGWAFLVEQRA